MSTTVGDLAAQVSSSFNLAKAAAWDPVGLQFGDPAAACDRVAVCHEVTAAVADRLIAEHVDLVITYHPLLFRPTTTLVAGRGATGRAFQLITAGVSLAAVHTGFDVLPGGTADSLAGALGLQDCVGFGPLWPAESVKVITFAPAAAANSLTEAMAAAGAGDIGRYSRCSYRTTGTGTFLAPEDASPAVGSAGNFNEEAETRIEMVAPASRVDAVVAALVAGHPYEEPAFDVIAVKGNSGFVGRVGDLSEPVEVAEFAAAVGSRIGGVVRHTGDGPVQRIAVLPGSGGSMLGSVSADVVVTGDVSHHQARDALARGMAVIDPGHAATERPGIKALYASVAEIKPGALDLTEVDADPWKES